MNNKSTIVLSVNRNNFINVHIWKDQATFLKRVGKWDKVDKKTYGFFHCPRIVIGPRCVIKTRIVGEIHLIKGYFGAGLFAHELMHFLTLWTSWKEYDPLGKDWERVAYLAGDLTAQFWLKHFQNKERNK